MGVRIAAIACLIVAILAACVIFADNSRHKGSPKPAASPRALVTVAPGQRDFGTTMDYARSPNLIVTTAGTDSGLPSARVFTTVRFSIDGKLVKTRTAPPYSITTLPTGQHVLTVTGTASGGDNARIQESYVK